MKIPALRYTAPHSVAEACAVLDADEDAKLIAGGQSLMPLLAIRLAAPSALVDLGRIPDLDVIDVAGEYLRIGAMATHADIIDSPLVRDRLPFLIAAGRHIAHAQIRSRGTMGGSLAHGDNAGEWPLALLALGGMVEVQSVRGRRTIDADDLFIGPYMTTIAADEVLTDIWIPARTRGWSFHEAARRSGDYGLALVGVSIELDGNRCTQARVVVGAAAGTVQRVTAAEEVLVDSVIGEDSARAAADAAGSSLSFIHDIHGSAHYRRHLVQGLTERAILEAGARR